MSNSTLQQSAFDKLSKLKVGALFMEMGTGKTKVALDLLYYKQHKVNYMLWICPCSLKGEIEAERQKWHPDMTLDVIGCESIGSSDRIYMELMRKVKDGNAFIVVDESLKIKNVHAKRTQRIIQLGDYAAYKLILNGTPVSRSVLDIWSQMEFLSPKILGMSYNEFKHKYCDLYKKGRYKSWVARTYNIPHLISLITPYIFDAELEIKTKKHYRTYGYSIDILEYQEYKDEIFIEYYDADRDDLNFNAFAMKLQKWYTQNSSLKEQVIDLAKSLDGGVIVFVRFLDSIPTGAARITGDTKQDERTEIINDFRSGLIKTLYITYGCGAYGLNLQSCHNMIFAEHTWDYAQRIQAEGRIYRMGQGNDVYYYDMVCRNVGLENMIFTCVAKKTNLLTDMKEEIAKKGGIKEWVKSI